MVGVGVQYVHKTIAIARRLWAQGCVGKTIVGFVALVVLSFCGAAGQAAGIIARPTPRPTTAPTIVAAKATEAPLPTETPTEAPTTVPTEAPSATALPTETPTEAPTTVPTEARPTGQITRADYGDAWPFTVEAGEVRCMNSRGPGSGDVVFIVNGTTYAINGTAKATKQYADVRPIWRDNPTIAGLKVSLQPILDLGLSLCS